MTDLSFKSYILSENRQILANKMGEILTYLQNVEDNLGVMKSNQIKNVPNQVKLQVLPILQTKWSNEDAKYVNKLAKISGGLMMGIDPNYKDQNLDLKQLIPTAVSEIEKIVSDMGTPVNNLASQEFSPDKDLKQTDKPEKPKRQIVPKKPQIKNDQSVAPAQPKTLEKDAPVTSPAGTGIDDYAQPLGGSGHGFDAF